MELYFKMQRSKLEVGEVQPATWRSSLSPSKFLENSDLAKAHLWSRRRFSGNQDGTEGPRIAREPRAGSRPSLRVSRECHLFGMLSALCMHFLCFRARHLGKEVG